MHEHPHSCEPRTSEIVLAEMDFQKEWSEEHSTGFETLQLDSEPSSASESIEERIDK